MAKLTNCVINGKEYYKLSRKIGKKLNKNGVWVDAYKTFYGSSKKEAESKYKEYLEKQNGSAEPITKQCFGEVIEFWIDTVFKSSELADGTKKLYIDAYHRYMRENDIAGQPLCNISSLDIQHFMNNEEIPYSARRSILNLLCRFFQYATINNICQNATACIQLKKPNFDSNGYSKIDVWEDQDLKKVIDSLKGHRLRLLVILAVNTGCRFSELLALTYDDIRDNTLYINKTLSEYDADNALGIHVTSPKTASSMRAIPLTERIMVEVKEHKRLQRLEMKKYGYITNRIFTTDSGNYYYRRNVAHALTRLYKRIGVPYHKFHSFRHTFATNLSRAGVPIEETSSLLGHSSIDVTAQYYVDISAKRKLEAVQKIAGFSF